jgi:hypothetical protein
MSAMCLVFQVLIRKQATLDKLQRNLYEVITMLLEDSEPSLESEFIGTQMVIVT